MRQFDTGAARDVDTNKPDYEGFLSPLVIEAYGRYMNANRMQADGKIRDSDNWQKGIPLDAYMKSAWRHFVDLWKAHRIIDPRGHWIEECCCAVLFNIMGYLHEHLHRSYKMSASSSDAADALSHTLTINEIGKTQPGPYHAPVTPKPNMFFPDDYVEALVNCGSLIHRGWTYRVQASEDHMIQINKLWYRHDNFVKKNMTLAS